MKEILFYANLIMMTACIVMVFMNARIRIKNRRRENLHHELGLLYDVVVEKIHNLDNIAEPGEDFEIMPLGELQVKSARLSAELREIEEIQDYISRRLKEL